MANLKLTLAVLGNRLEAIVNEELLVLNDAGAYVPIPKAKYVSLVFAGAGGLVYNLMNAPINADHEMETILAKVLSVSVDSSPINTPIGLPVDTANDPTGGECYCLLTCSGTKLSFVKVTQNE